MYILISVRTAPPVETAARTPLIPMNDSVSIFKDGRAKPGSI